MAVVLPPTPWDQSLTPRAAPTASSGQEPRDPEPPALQTGVCLERCAPCLRLLQLSVIAPNPFLSVTAHGGGPEAGL